MKQRAKVARGIVLRGRSARRIRHVRRGRDMAPDAPDEHDERHEQTDGSFDRRTR
jgi:hypothetical protein